MECFTHCEMCFQEWLFELDPPLWNSRKDQSSSCLMVISTDDSLLPGEEPLLHLYRLVFSLLQATIKYQKTKADVT